MPKVLFYTGTAFCFFLALSSAAESTREWQGGWPGFVAVRGLTVSLSSTSAWAIAVSLLAGLVTAAILVRMASLLAARNLFGAFLALFSVSAAVTSLAWLLLLQTRMLMLVRQGMLLHDVPLRSLTEMHFAAFMMLGCFVSIALLALRSYFRVQASRFLSALVFFPLPLFLLILLQELLTGGSPAPLPASSPASLVFFAVNAVLFFSIAVHCIRHRHMFIEITNLRELLDGRIDPAGRASGPIRLSGGVAFDS